MTSPPPSETGPETCCGCDGPLKGFFHENCICLAKMGKPGCKHWPSETGPSAEAVEKAKALRTSRCPHEPLYWYGCNICVALALEAAKRSAHLEDARAGCEYCKRGLVPTHQGPYGWVHDEVTASCYRPEVWDALSLLGGK